LLDIKDLNTDTINTLYPNLTKYNVPSVQIEYPPLTSNINLIDNIGVIFGNVDFKYDEITTNGQIYELTLTGLLNSTVNQNLQFNWRLGDGIQLNNNSFIIPPAQGNTGFKIVFLISSIIDRARTSMTFTCDGVIVQRNSAVTIPPSFFIAPSFTLPFKVFLTSSTNITLTLNSVSIFKKF